MLVVADASVLVQALTKFDVEGDAIRDWLTSLTDGRPVEVLQNFTQLEFLSALRKLNRQEELSDDVAERAIKAFAELPSRRRQITQPMAVRIWELRNNITAYDAAYVALVETLQSKEGHTVLATTDIRLARAPTLSIRVELFQF